MQLPAIYSTVGADAIAATVEASHETGPIPFAALVNRGINDIYELRGADGRRWVVRLGGWRFRGPPNLAYETALLAHLEAKGAPVVAAIAGRDGALGRLVDAAEGARSLTLFPFIEGETPLKAMIATGKLDTRTLEGLRAIGHGMGRVHGDGAAYDGPASLYQLDAGHLLHRPLQALAAVPASDDGLRAEFAAVVADLEARLAVIAPGLSLDHAHGDGHFGNALVRDETDGTRSGVWFDFDDCGPGYRAYDLGVFLWAMLRHTRSAALNETGAAMWRAYVEGYARVAAIPPADWKAVGLFVAIRQMWFVGEYASRTPQWGTLTISRDWLAGELASLRRWVGLVTPEV